MKRRILSIVLMFVIVVMAGCGSKASDSEVKREFHSSAGKEGTYKIKNEAGMEEKSGDYYEGTTDGSYDIDLPSISKSGDYDDGPATSSIEGSGSSMDRIIDSEAKKDAPSDDAYGDIGLVEGDWVIGDASYDEAYLRTEGEASIADDMYDFDILPDDKKTDEYMMNARAGLLTAGEWNDNDNWGFFANVISSGQLPFPSFGLMPLNRVAVTVQNETGNPVRNARVTLKGSSGEIIWEAVTDYKGMAFLFYNAIVKSTALPSTVEVTKGGAFITESVDLNVVNDEQGQGRVGLSAVTHDMVVTLQDATDNKALDIMFVFDTTGSMSDELFYLQKEFEDIAQRVADQNTRFCVNFYRDNGDAYIVKSNEFTADTTEVLRQLNNEYAEGGGDYPEAVDQALHNGILEHSWNSDSVKLLFLILDAPPHSDDPQIDDSLANSIKEAAKQGIRIIPIASSGVDKTTEAFLRTSAMMTGGTYTFLTDDSGIGYSHLEPTIGSYQVEQLNECIIRIIKTYYQ